MNVRAMVFRAILSAAMSCCLMVFAVTSKADSKPPYTGAPAVGATVRFDGTPGGAKTAWAYADREWLERYLRVTIDAAAANRAYGDSTVQNQLNVIADHVAVVPNGTKASVETVDTFSYGGLQDTVVRVMIGEGPMRGREFWTTCAELVDAAGHPYLRM